MLLVITKENWKKLNQQKILRFAMSIINKMSKYINNRELYLSIFIVALNLYLDFANKYIDVDTVIKLMIALFVNIFYVLFTWYIFLRNNKDTIRQNIIYLLALCFVTILS